MTVKDRWSVHPAPPNPWPFLSLVAIIVVGGLIAWGSLTPTGSNAPSVSASAPIVQTVLVLASETPTPGWTSTARVIVVTQTATATPVLPWCDQAKAGSVCVQVPIPRTATAITACDPHPTYQRVCVKSASDTEAEDLNE